MSVIVFVATFLNLEDTAEVLPAHDEFVQSMEELARSRGLLYPYL